MLVIIELGYRIRLWERVSDNIQRIKLTIWLKFQLLWLSEDRRLCIGRLLSYLDDCSEMDEA